MGGETLVKFRKKRPEFQWHALATYNSERARGLVHTAEWEAQMAAQQVAFDAWAKTEFEENLK